MGTTRPKSVSLGFTVLLGCALAAACSSGSSESDVPIDRQISEPAQEEGELRMRVLRTVGDSSETDSGAVLFGGSTKSGMQVGPDGRLYVLDRQLKNVRLFDRTGSLRRTLMLSEGSGPGEVQDPATLAVTEGGKMWVGDPDARRIIVFDRSGEEIATFSENAVYWDLYPCPRVDCVWAVRWRRNVRQGDPVIRAYSESGEVRYAFGQELNVHRVEKIKRELKSAYYTHLAFTEDRVLASIEIPYDIFVYDAQSRDLLMRFGREMEAFDEVIVKDPQTVNFKHPGAKTSALAALGNDLILHFIYDWTEEDTFVHAFRSDGSFLGEVRWSSMSDTDLSQSVAVATDPSANLVYVMASDPYLQIVQLRVEIGTESSSEEAPIDPGA